MLTACYNGEYFTIELVISTLFMKNFNTPRPRTQAPNLSLTLTDGTAWSLQEQQPESFTMVVFYRGLHCPVCKGYTKTLNKLIDQYKEKGVELITASMDTQDRAEKTVEEWQIDNLAVGYGLTENQAKSWGLYLSESIKDKEPNLFSEPGLFLIRPDGELYYAATNSMPFGRPDLKDLLQSIGFILEEDYPARGEVAPE